MFNFDLSSLGFSDDEFEIDGIYYSKIKNNSVSVVSSNWPFLCCVNIFESDYIGAIQIPASITHNNTIYSVIKINDSAFEGCKKLSKITIPNSVLEIGRNAFKGCISLRNLVIPNSITQIKDSAFEGCEKLSKITIPNSVLEIGQNAFKDCISLRNLTISESITKIRNSTFSCCSSLTNITIPNSHIVFRSPKQPKTTRNNQT